MKIYDISVEISQDMEVYSDAEKVSINEIYQLEQGDPCNLTRISLTGHSGSHVDLPLHFIKNSAACDTIPLGCFYGISRLVHLPPGPGDISPDELLPLDIKEGEILLLGTNKRLFQPTAAAFLAEKQIKTLGVDSISIDESPGWPVHKILLGRGIPIIEGLLLEGIPQGTYEISALPLKIKNGNGSPVRAILVDRRRLELVIFDMDGLMLDTELTSKEGWRLGLKHYGLDFPEELFNRLLGSTIDTVRKILTEHYGADLDFDSVRAMRRAYVAEQVEKHGILMKKGLIHLLDRLDQLGVKKFIATSSDYSSMKARMDRHDLLSRFDGYITGDQVSQGKPNPEIFLRAASLMNVTAENCVVLEDSFNGIAAASAAGMRPIMVPDLIQPDRATLARIFAKCEDLEEAADVIAGLL